SRFAIRLNDGPAIPPLRDRPYQITKAPMHPTYLDYNASTPVDPAVAAAMRPLLETAFGNPSSGHWASGAAKSALEQARGQVAALLGASAEDIVFTGGAG